MQLLLDIIFAAITLFSGMKIWDWVRGGNYATNKIEHHEVFLNALAQQLQDEGFFLQNTLELKKTDYGLGLYNLTLQYKQQLEKQRNIWLAILIIVLIISFLVGGIVVFTTNILAFFVSILFSPTGWAKEYAEVYLRNMLNVSYWFFHTQKITCEEEAEKNFYLRRLLEAVRRADPTIPKGFQSNLSRVINKHTGEPYLVSTVKIPGEKELWETAVMIDRGSESAQYPVQLMVSSDFDKNKIQAYDQFSNIQSIFLTNKEKCTPDDIHKIVTKYIVANIQHNWSDVVGEFRKEQ